MFNASNYPDQTLDTYEILGGYIVGIFYNHMYDKAKELHTSGNIASKTEAYKVVCRAYLQHFSREDLFKTTLKNVYEYFTIHSPISILSYGEWVDNLTREFVPTDYWISLPSKRKDQILGVILEKVFKNFSTYMLTPRALNMVIDKHDVKSNVALIQDQMLRIMIEVREEMYQKFIKPTLGGAGEVSPAVAEKLKTDLQKEIKRTELLKAALIKANETIKQQKTDLTAMQQKLDISDQKCQYLLNKAINQHDEIQKLTTAAAAIVVPSAFVTSSSVSSPTSAAADHVDIQPRRRSANKEPPVAVVEVPVKDDFDPYEEIEDTVNQPSELDQIMAEFTEPEPVEERTQLADEVPNIDTIKRQAREKREKRLIESKNNNVKPDSLFD